MKIIAKVLILYPLFIGVFLFLPAGTTRYTEAWIYSLALFIPMITTLLYLVKYDPKLLERRMRFKEKEAKQKLIIRLSKLPFMLGFLIPGFDYRFNWSEVPMVLVVISNILVLTGYFWVFLVFKENSYTSRIVEVEKEQEVITSGTYALVRHPMYLGTIVMFLCTPIALGSWWAFIVFVLWPVILVFRILDEERVLMKDLKGYKEYCEKTRYRLIPFVW